jgi:hypothetical protein
VQKLEKGHEKLSKFLSWHGDDKSKQISWMLYLPRKNKCIYIICMMKLARKGKAVNSFWLKKLPSLFSVVELKTPPCPARACVLFSGYS